MNLVCVKPVPDVSNVAVSASQNRAFERGKRLLNPLDESAIERAVASGESTAVVVGIEEDLDVLRGALARGAARGILITHADARSFDAAAIARILGALATREQADRIFFGVGWPAGALGQVGYRVMEETPVPVTVVPSTGPAKLPSAMAIMKSMKKEIRRMDAGDLGVDLSVATTVRSLGLT
jgi:electron transfer flavoprotein beta subunit